MKKVYIAGPMCFLQKSLQAYNNISKACMSNNLEAVIPVGPNGIQAAGLALMSSKIYKEDLARLMKSDAVIANITAFRGPSADAGTIFEVAYALAKGKPVFAYDEDDRCYRQKVEEEYSNTIQNYQGHTVDHNFDIIEDFGLTDNLMLIEAFRSPSGRLEIHNSLGEAVAACRKFFINGGKIEEKLQNPPTSQIELTEEVLFGTRIVPISPAAVQRPRLGYVTVVETYATTNPAVSAEYDVAATCEECDGEGCGDCD